MEFRSELCPGYSNTWKWFDPQPFHCCSGFLSLFSWKLNLHSSLQCFVSIWPEHFLPHVFRVLWFVTNYKQNFLFFSLPFFFTGMTCGVHDCITSSCLNPLNNFISDLSCVFLSTYVVCCKKKKQNNKLLDLHKTTGDILRIKLATLLNYGTLGKLNWIYSV